MKLLCSLCIVLGLSLFSLKGMCKDITISGLVLNADVAKSSPEIKAYIPGSPFFDVTSQELTIIKKGNYDVSTGEYSLSITVPDAYLGNIIVGATYLDTSYGDIEAIATTYININNGDSFLVNIDLEGVIRNEIGFKARIFHDGKEYDYTRSYRCIIVSSDYLASGRIFFLAHFDYILNRNNVRGVPQGDYKMACFIINLSGSGPNSLRRIIDVTIPVVDDQGQPLPEENRYVDIIFDGSDINGESF